MKLLGRSWTITLSELISGLIFLAMGGYITYLAWANRLAMSSEYQLQMNLFLAGVQNKVSRLTAIVPNFIWAIIVVAVLIGLIVLFIKQIKNRKHEQI